MSATELPILSMTTAAAASARSHDQAWLTAAKRARPAVVGVADRMSVEGIVGLVAGFEANPLSLLIWAASSFVEGLASVTIIWRFTGSWDAVCDQ